MYDLLLPQGTEESFYFFSMFPFVCPQQLSKNDWLRSNEELD